MYWTLSDFNRAEWYQVFWAPTTDILTSFKRIELGTTRGRHLDNFISATPIGLTKLWLKKLLLLYLLPPTDSALVMPLPGQKFWNTLNNIYCHPQSRRWSRRYLDRCFEVYWIYLLPSSASALVPPLPGQKSWSTVRHERVRGFCPLTSTLGILVYRDDSLSVRAYRRRCIEVT